MAELFSYQVCAQASNIKLPPGSPVDRELQIYQVKVDADGKCIPPGEEAMRSLEDVSKAYVNGIVDSKICELLRAAGKCPKKYLQIP